MIFQPRCLSVFRFASTWPVQVVYGLGLRGGRVVVRYVGGYFFPSLGEGEERDYTYNHTYNGLRVIYVTRLDDESSDEKDSDEEDSDGDPMEDEPEYFEVGGEPLAMATIPANWAIDPREEDEFSEDMDLESEAESGLDDGSTVRAMVTMMIR